MTLRRALRVLSIVIVLGGPSGVFVHALRSQPVSVGTMTVSFLLGDGRQHVFGPIDLRPAPRSPWRGRELPYAGSSAMTAVWLKPTSGVTHMFMLKEGSGDFGGRVSLSVMPVGFPSDGIIRERETVDDGPARSPCVAVSAFFVDGIGDAPKGPAVAWLREGGRETGFVIQPEMSVRMRPILSVDTARDAVLGGQSGEHFLEIEKSPESEDVMVVAIATKEDGSLTELIVPSGSRRTSTNGLLGPGENKVWRFYALDDRRELHSRCRSTTSPMRSRLRSTGRFMFAAGQQYPGFRVLRAYEFRADTSRAFVDDISGPLVSGHFNYDGFEDFAALLVRDYPMLVPSTHGTAARQPGKEAEVHEGKEVVCFGTAMRETFRCDAKPVTLTLPRQAYLQRMPPGRYQCVTASRRPRTVTTTIASVGAIDGEGVSTFVGQNRDGSTFPCAVRLPGPAPVQ